jgi:hypothetical protein
MPDLTAIQERFDAIAAEALENLIEDVESKDRVKVTALEVVLIPEQARDPGCPAVEVNLTVKAIRR